MSIVTLLLVLIVLGVAAWAVNRLPMIAPPIRTIIHGLLVVIALIYVFAAFGLIDFLHAPVPRAR